MSENDIPFLLVCEEAHNYIPRKDNSMYNASKNLLKNCNKQFLGYINKSNVTIIDLSGIPYEVLSITVSLVSRLILIFHSIILNLNMRT